MTQPEGNGSGSTPVLQLRGVRAAYGRIEVLHGVDLLVPRNSIVALLGPNGAGKTTTLKVASGQMRPIEGEVLVAGRPVQGASADVLVRAGVCSIPEGRGIFPNLTVEENLRLATFADVSLEQVKERTYSQFPRLGERRHQLAGTMSGGEQQMLALARALTTDPALLMLDELSMGLAPLIVAELYDLVAQIAEQGVAILLVEQFARIALPVATYAAVMAQGKIVDFGEPDDIADGLSAAYLGGAA